MLLLDGDWHQLKALFDGNLERTLVCCRCIICTLHINLVKVWHRTRHVIPPRRCKDVVHNKITLKPCDLFGLTERKKATVVTV